MISRQLALKIILYIDLLDCSASQAVDLKPSDAAAEKFGMT